MKTYPRLKKLALKTDTLRVLDTNQLAAAQGGGVIYTITTTIFSEGACETYSWWYACKEK